MNTNRTATESRRCGIGLAASRAPEVDAALQTRVGLLAELREIEQAEFTLARAAQRSGTRGAAAALAPAQADLAAVRRQLEVVAAVEARIEAVRAGGQR